MAIIGGCILVVCVIQYCVSKPVQVNVYPEENRQVNNPSLFEGDMLLSPRQKQLALSGGDVAMVSGRKRGATRTGLWLRGNIPYKIDSSMLVHEPAIRRAMDEWQNGTCIKFVPWTNEPYHLLIKSGYGCYAVVGRLPFYPTMFLVLGAGCYNHETILHELGHTIGFWHEQSRPDRDNYVTINTDNIMPGKSREFIKYPNSRIDSLGVAYDYRSIMHYGPKAFTNDLSKNTIESKDPSVTLKKNVKISSLDMIQTNLLYNCRDSSA